MHLRATSERTYGGEGRRYVGSSGDRGRDVEISISVVASLNVREIVTASRGLDVRASQSSELESKPQALVTTTMALYATY